MSAAPFPAEFLQKARRVPANTGSPDAATWQTCQIMAELVQSSADDPLIERFADESAQRWGPLVSLGGEWWRNPLCIAFAIWWGVKHAMRFVHHSKQIWLWFGERDQLQLLIEPSVLVRMQGGMQGDCAIYSMLICAMLDHFGIPWVLETLSTNPNQPDVYNHIFPLVLLPDGSSVPLDCSHGTYPGWRVPDNNTLRSQVWDMQGQPIAADWGRLELAAA